MQEPGVVPDVVHHPYVLATDKLESNLKGRVGRRGRRMKGVVSQLWGASRWRICAAGHLWADLFPLLLLGVGWDVDASEKHGQMWAIPSPH